MNLYELSRHSPPLGGWCSRRGKRFSGRWKVEGGLPGWIRTSDPQLRRLLRGLPALRITMLGRTMRLPSGEDQALRTEAIADRGMRWSVGDAEICAPPRAGVRGRHGPDAQSRSPASYRWIC